MAKDYVTAWFKKQHPLATKTINGSIYVDSVPRYICKSGFSFSIQAGKSLYCSPRMNLAKKYNSVEIGFPDKKVKELMPYAEDPKDPTGTVYGYVPIEIINKIIEKEGGPE